MNELTAQELKTVTLALTGQLMEQKEKIATKNYSDEYTLKLVNDLKDLQKVYEKLLRIENSVNRLEQN